MKLLSHLDYNQTIVIHTNGLKSVMYTLQDFLHRNNILHRTIIVRTVYTPIHYTFIIHKGIHICVVVGGRGGARKVSHQYHLLVVL